MSNNYWNGSNGNMWLNDSDFDKVKSYEVKMTLDWEEVPNGLSKERVLMGYSYEGKFVYRKTDKNHTTVMDLIFKDYSNGIVTDVSIIGKAYNKTTGKVERIKVTGITFDELELQKWEEKSLVEVEMPFKASKVEIL